MRAPTASFGSNSKQSHHETLFMVVFKIAEKRHLTHNSDMPQRASRQAIASTLGKRLFRTDKAVKIEKKLKSIGDEKLKKTLAMHGVKNMDAETLSQVFAGGKRTHVSEFELRKIVSALQDKEVHLVSGARAADKIVLTAMREAQEENKGQLRGLSPEQIKLRLKELARERRQEADQEQTLSGTSEHDQSAMGILDRMRGAMGRANQDGSQPAETTVKATRVDDLPSGSASSLMNKSSWRKDMQLQPKMTLNRPASGNGLPPDLPFQA